MPTSSLTSRVNGSEFSAWYDLVRYIIVRGVATGAADGTVITATLVREDGFGVIATKTPVVAGGSGAFTATFDLQLDCIDSSGVMRQHDGKYHVHLVSGDNGTTADTATFDVMLAGATELKDLFLRGVDMIASNTTTARQQPRTVTGVTIGEVSTTHLKGMFTLAYDATAHTLTWDGGTAVAVDTVIPNTYILGNADGTAWMEANVIGELLPVTNQSESIVLDSDQIEDVTIQTLLRQAYGEMQGRLHIDLEPTTYDTEDPSSPSFNGATYTERFAEAVGYYPQQYGLRQWMTIKLPHPWIQVVHRLEGFYNTSRVFFVDPASWVVKNKRAGELQLVPKQGASLTTLSFVGTGFFSVFGQGQEIPSFWHFRITCGLPMYGNTTEYERVRKAILKMAAIEVLTLAGQASAPGLTGESTSRDGVSESRSYAQGQGGRYANIIAKYTTDLWGDGKYNKGEIQACREKFQGLYFVTL